MEKTFHTPDPVTLHVELGSGDVVVHTQPTDETVVQVDGRGADQVVVEQRGDDVVVLAKQRGGGLFGSSHDLSVHVTLPDESRLSTKLGSADLVVQGRVGECTLKTGSGDVRVDVVTGSAHVQTGSGDVSIDQVQGPLELKSGSGDVELGHAAGPLDVATGSGDVAVARADGPVQVKSGSGDLRVRQAATDLTLTTASGDLVVDRVERGQLAARNVSGDIRVGIPYGVPVWTDVSSVTGTVSSDLAGVGAPEDGQDYIELRATTVSGDVSLEQV